MVDIRKNGSGNNEKGVAFAKRAKIDSEQKGILIAVCLASMVLGITVVGAVYLIKVIQFNAKVISVKDTVISDYTSIQKSLDSINQDVIDLSSNENLESVGRQRSTQNCSGTDAKTWALSEGYKASEIELARTCSALRVISDTLPSTNNSASTLASLNQLIAWSGTNMESLSSSAVTNSSDYSSIDSESSTAHIIAASMVLSDSADKIKGTLAQIESSIRNYDISSAAITWVKHEGTAVQSIELNATYNAYYSDPVSITKKHKLVCADDKNAKCTGTTTSTSGSK